MANQKFGRILVLSFSHIHNHEAMWNCICDCGKGLLVSGHNLRAGYTKSCGCLNKEKAGERFTKHGKSRTRLYKIWQKMHERCNNPNSSAFRWYGRKGIKVCEDWDEFEPFYFWAISNGYAPNLTIDRKDSNKNYCPDNCQWLTRAENTKKAHLKRGAGQ